MKRWTLAALVFMSGCWCDDDASTRDELVFVEPENVPEATLATCRASAMTEECRAVCTLIIKAAYPDTDLLKGVERCELVRVGDREAVRVRYDIQACTPGD